MVFIQYGALLSVRNRRMSILTSNPLWGPRRNLAVPLGMIGTALIAVTNLYGPGLNRVFLTTPILGKFWGPPFGFALGVLIMDETRKLIVRTYPKVSIISRPCCFVCADMGGCSLLSPRWLGDIYQPDSCCSMPTKFIFDCDIFTRCVYAYVIPNTRVS
jgi:hypothetical protein